MTVHRMPWRMIFAMAFLLSGWLVGAFDAPKSPNQSSPDTTPQAPAVPAPATPIELTPEQKKQNRRREKLGRMQRRLRKILRMPNLLGTSPS